MRFDCNYYIQILNIQSTKNSNKFDAAHKKYNDEYKWFDFFFFGLFVNKTQKTMKREEKKRQIVSILSKLIPNTYLNYKYY